MKIANSWSQYSISWNLYELHNDLLFLIEWMKDRKVGKLKGNLHDKNVIKHGDIKLVTTEAEGIIWCDNQTTTPQNFFQKIYQRWK